MGKIRTFFAALLPNYGFDVRFRFFLRLREAFRKKRLLFLGKCLKAFLHKRYGCELGVTAEISPSCMFMHSVGVVIGDGAIVEEGVKIYSGVVLGRKNIETKTYPRVKSGAILGCNASILGDVVIENDCIIGANSVVNRDCDLPGAVYAGVPAKLISKRQDNK